MCGDRVTLLTATAPTPNGALHLGHLSGPYLACDIAARAARARGEHVLTMCGVDPHQNYVPARAKALGEPVEQVLDRYEGQVRQAFDAAGIGYDIYLRPRDDKPYRDGVAALLSDLVTSKAVAMEEVDLRACGGCGRTLHHIHVSGRCPVCGNGASGGGCEGCGSLRTAADLIEPRSTCCDAPTIARLESVPVLRLEDYRDQLTEVWSRAVMPARVRRLIAKYLNNGLPAVPLAYPTDWGIEWAGPAGQQRVDVWVEMGLGYLYGVARELDPAGREPRTAADCANAWTRVDGVWHFFGIDNATYYTLLFPGLFAAAGLPAGVLRGVVVNEFYRLDGAKFSTSRNHAIWAHEYLGDQDPADVRLFLSWDRPDRRESDFTRASYEAFRDWYHRMRQGAAVPLPPQLAVAEMDRGEAALHPAAFDPALAIRCGINALGSQPDRARALLALIEGRS